MPRDKTGRDRRPGQKREAREALGVMLAAQLEEARRAEAGFKPLLMTTFRLELDPRGIRHAHVEPSTFDHEDLSTLRDLVTAMLQAEDALTDHLTEHNQEVETDAWIYTLDGEGELLVLRREPEPAHNLRVFSIN